jgi:hypothetical protein
MNQTKNKILKFTNLDSINLMAQLELANKLAQIITLEPKDSRKSMIASELVIAVVQNNTSNPKAILLQAGVYLPSAMWPFSFYTVVDNKANWKLAKENKFTVSSLLVDVGIDVDKLVEEGSL